MFKGIVEYLVIGQHKTKGEEVEKNSLVVLNPTGLDYQILSQSLI